MAPFAPALLVEGGTAWAGIHRALDKNTGVEFTSTPEAGAHLKCRSVSNPTPQKPLLCGGFLDTHSVLKAGGRDRPTLLREPSDCETFPLDQAR